MNDKIKKIFKCIGLVFLFITFSSIFFIIFNININDITDKAFLIYYTLSNLILCGFFIIIYKKDLKNDITSYNKKIFFTSFKYWVVGFILMFISNYIITYILGMKLADNELTVRNYINVSPLLMILNACILAPITEELIFRKSIKEAINNKWIYITVSGLTFGFIHILSFVGKPIYIIHLFPYAFLGIAFASLYYKTKNIYSTIVVHAIHNMIAIIIYLLGVTL